jgi:hypothetical protein
LRLKKYPAPSRLRSSAQAGPQHPVGLSQRRRHVGDVLIHLGRGDHIELALAERQLCRLARPELDGSRPRPRLALPGDSKHGVARVYPANRSAWPERLGHFAGQETRPGANVE